ncbi:MAG: hypothetical protein HZB95_07135 [Nitrosomonadales bacterium]|nr:hypothetical protein [Nitrosomonadales bacterium]
MPAETKELAGRKVLVSSNCQTGGVAAALQVIFPDDEVTPVPLPALDNAEAVESFVQKLGNADVWVSIGGHDLLQKHGLAERVKLIRIPIVRFSGFHPDLVYARKTSTKELIDPHYNSAIAIWAYKNGLSIDDAERLFNNKVFAGLGYLNHWQPSIEQLKQRFKDSDLEFTDFILPMRREGVFMYSLNHPKVIALARLAKLVAVKMGADKEVLTRNIDINDGLNEIIWPIYPAIGDSLALHSGYEWKMGEGKWISGLRAYLMSAYENYANQDISPNDIFAVQIDEQKYDRVLRAELGRRA